MVTFSLEKFGLQCITGYITPDLETIISGLFLSTNKILEILNTLYFYAKRKIQSTLLILEFENFH